LVFSIPKAIGKSLVIKIMLRIAIFILFVCTLVSCRKEWEQPVLYTTNLSLYFEPDSVDQDLVYYYSDGMKLQIKYEVTADGESFRNQVWENQRNDHWGEMGTVIITGKVVSLSTDTSLHIENYPLVMRVYRDGGQPLYEEVRVENKYSY
jgi:hypothetical protein